MTPTNLFELPAWCVFARTRRLSAPADTQPSSEAEILRAHIAAVRTRIDVLDGGAHMSKRIFLAMASLAALVLSSGANVSWMR